MTPTDIAPWNRSLNAAVALVAHFERLIATGQLAPGERLPSERDLAVRMSVSRSTLREAMHELESKRLIERARGRGTIVARKPLEVSELIEQLPPDSSIEYVLELRSVVEPRIAGFAAQRATTANILQLRDVLERSSANMPAPESLRLDVEFHLLLAQAAQNPLLSALCALTSEWTNSVRVRAHGSRSGRQSSISGHHAIFDAISAHDCEGAQAAMRSHLRDVGKLMTTTTAAAQPLS
jgi:GntR family transcriptional repressor for pyruvate dehydrogenase complex